MMWEGLLYYALRGVGLHDGVKQSSLMTGRGFIDFTK